MSVSIYDHVLMIYLLYSLFIVPYFTTNINYRTLLIRIVDTQLNKLILLYLSFIINQLCKSLL